MNKFVKSALVALALVFALFCFAACSASAPAAEDGTVIVPEVKVEVNPTPVTVEAKVDAPAVEVSIEPIVVPAPQVTVQADTAALPEIALNGVSVIGDGWRVVTLEDSIVVTVNYYSAIANPDYVSETETPYEPKLIGDELITTRDFVLTYSYKVLAVDGLGIYAPRTNPADFETDLIGAYSLNDAGALLKGTAKVKALDASVINGFAVAHQDYEVIKAIMVD